MNCLKEEKEDVNYVWKFYENRKKIILLKDIYFRNKDNLNLVKLLFDFEEYNLENMKYFVSISVVCVNMYEIRI